MEKTVINLIEGKAWQRQQNESAKAFHAFILYRDMLPKERSIQKVLDKSDRKPSYYRHLARWSSRYEWVKRATAHDDHLAEVRSESQIHAVKEMAERHAKQGMALQALGMKKFYDDDGKLMLQSLLFMDERDAIRAIEVGAKLERTARGEPTEIIKGDVVVSPKRIEDYTDAELDFIIQNRRLPQGE